MRGSVDVQRSVGQPCQLAITNVCNVKPSANLLNHIEDRFREGSSLKHTHRKSLSILAALTLLLRAIERNVPVVVTPLDRGDASGGL